MKNTTIRSLIAAVVLTAMPVMAQDTVTTDDLFRSGEINLDVFGSISYGQSTINNITATRARHDARLGAGVGMSYFINRYFGIGGDMYTESAGHNFIDGVSGSLIGRFPIGDSGFAPYGFGGAGYQFDLGDAAYLHVGGGVEYRFSPSVGIFLDGRYMFLDKASDIGLIRLGARFAF